MTSMNVPEHTAEQQRVGVYVCHCGTNIAGTIDVEQVAQWASAHLKDRGVVIARDYKFMCSSLGQELIEKDIKGWPDACRVAAVRRTCTSRLFARPASAPG
jgi:heterodisulfide reductase subunit A-like polyferredoxin